MAAIDDPATKTRAKVAAKNTAKANLVNNLRILNRVAQANPALTDEQKVELGLPVYSARSPINPPTDVPVIELVSNAGRTTKLNLRTTGSDRRGRPGGVQGALVLSYVSDDQPPQDITLWKVEGLTTRTTFQVVWSSAIPAGSQVWLSAAWYNPRGQAGPACSPVNLYIAGGLGAATQTVSATATKKAA
jgi:hypothetical protein